MDFILNPGAYFSVSVPYKITAVALAAGEVIPPGTLIIPPPNPVLAAVSAAHDTAAKITEVAEAAINPLAAKVDPPWEITFTEKR